MLNSKFQLPLDKLFEKAKSENRALLLAYIPAGFPTVEQCKKIISAMIEGGVDAVEIGFPYSDPVMDGPIIQAAAVQALANKVNMEDLFDIAKHTTEIGGTALAMTYWNPIEKYGVDKFVTNAKSSGINAVITPDLTVEESNSWIEMSNQNQLGRVYVVAPSSSDKRLELVSANCRGFVYAASLMGVTGVRSELSQAAEKLVGGIKKYSTEPVCVGLGVSNAQQVAQIAKYADGVIVGSAFIKVIQESKDEAEQISKVRELALELSSGLKRS